MNAIQIARTRYTAKHYDPAKRVSDADLATLLEVLRLSPSSVNSQPWEFFVAGSEEAKSKLMPAVLDFNRERVQHATSTNCSSRRLATAATATMRPRPCRRPAARTSWGCTGSVHRNS